MVLQVGLELEIVEILLFVEANVSFSAATRISLIFPFSSSIRSFASAASTLSTVLLLVSSPGHSRE